jgi:PAS domain S-box-containing protein
MEEQNLLLDNIQTLVWFLNDVHAIRAVNKATADFFGVSKACLENKSAYEVLSPEEADDWIAGNVEVFQTKKQILTEKWYKNSHGEPRLLAITRTPQLDDRGHVQFVVCSAEDMTDRKRGEDALRETTARFEALLEALPDMIYFKGVDRRYWIVNKAFERITGRGRKRIVGMTAEEALPADLAGQVRESDEHVIRTGQVAVVEQRFIGDARETIILETIKFPVLDHHGHVIGIGGASRDITKRKEVEQAILRAKEQWERTFDSVPDLMAILDQHHRIVRLNKAMVEKLGITGQEAEGKHCFEIVHGAASPPPFCPHALLMKDGQQHTTEIFEPTWGGTFLMSASPIRDSNGALTGCVHIARDVTERRMAEKLVIQAERLKALADLAAGASHNFNNLLQIIMGNARMGLTNLESADISEIKKDLEAILASCHFGAETVKRLQDFSRSRRDTKVEGASTFDLSNLVEQAVAVSKPWWNAGSVARGGRVHLHQRLDSNCLVTGRKSEIFEVVVNLIKNAVDVLPHGGVILLETSALENHVLLRVRDNGVGIPQENLHKVFEPFFTTKGSLGTGMGLASSFGIIRGHGGQMSVQSQEGRGTVFTVQLLRTKARSDESTPPVIAGIPDWRVLVIDDHWPIVELLQQGLARYGPAVLGAFSGSEGVGIFQEKSVDLVVCDLGMPGMDGWEVGKRIKEICANRGMPKTPFILLTGWGDQGQENHRRVDSGVDAIMEKPADISKLLAVARQLVDK